MTENSQDVWKNEYPYLSSVKDFDKNNPKLRWQKKFSNEELKSLFPKIGGIKKIEILNITNTGRVKNVKLLGYYGSDQMSGVDIRKRMNLKSNFVRFKFIEDNKIEFNNNNSKLLTTNKFEDEPLSHIVKAGDSLNDIAYKYNVSVYEIIDLNSIKDSSLIKINQKLLIPRNSSNTSSTIEKILVVSGSGSGHGVGMSQWGAKYMASKGQKAERILKHFYKGVRIKPFSKNFL
jgi:stage II sporulation protein D